MGKICPLLKIGKGREYPKINEISKISIDPTSAKNVIQNQRFFSHIFSLTLCVIVYKSCRTRKCLQKLFRHSFFYNPAFLKYRDFKLENGNIKLKCAYKVLPLLIISSTIINSWRECTYELCIFQRMSIT